MNKNEEFSSSSGLEKKQAEFVPIEKRKKKMLPPPPPPPPPLPGTAALHLSIINTNDVDSKKCVNCTICEDRRIPGQKVNNLYRSLQKGHSNRRSNNPSESSEETVMSRCLFRRHRRKLVLLLIGGLCFAAGIVVPLIFRHFSSGSSSSQTSSRLRPLPSFVGGRLRKADYGGLRDSSDVLKDLFISVKTTKKYHHPRLVILLETWVSLAKSQVG